MRQKPRKPKLPRVPVPKPTRPHGDRNLKSVRLEAVRKQELRGFSRTGEDS